MRYRYLRFPGGKPKAVTLSYDDGVIHDIRLSRICDQYGLKCTFNINAGLMPAAPDPYKLTADEIKTHLLDHGHEVAVHGNFHKALGLCSAVDGIKDVLDCRVALENLFQRIIRGMAYADSGITKMANGADYQTIRNYLRDLGIVYARTLSGDNNRFFLPEDWYAWMPTAHHKNPRTLEWAEEFVALTPDEGYMPRRYPRLFYLWGHSYEFQNDGNWDLLESICRTLGNREDTWYATNMEIYEYVHAYDSLIFSAEGTRVYNPAQIEVCFCTEKALYTVLPGQEMVLDK